MNSSDVNSIINNLCDKLGTTANKLIPEMAGYQIAKHSIWLAISLIFIGVAIGFTIKLLCEMEDIYLSKDPEVVERLKKVFRGYQPPSEEGEECKDE